jgi:Putative peptidoglycan binding domain
VDTQDPSALAAEGTWPERQAAWPLRQDVFVPPVADGSQRGENATGTSEQPPSDPAGLTPQDIGFEEPAFGELEFEAEDLGESEQPGEAQLEEAEADFEDEGPSCAAGSCAADRCARGTGPPRARPDPVGHGLHPPIFRGAGGHYSRNPSVGHAQQLLNAFLRNSGAEFNECPDRSPARLRRMQSMRQQLRRDRQDPLVADGRFEGATELATRLFQTCQGLVPDGKIGPITWARLEHWTSVRPLNAPDTEECGVPNRPAGDLELELAGEIQELDETQQHRTVRARLSLFQNATDRRARNHFRCQAVRKAREIDAYAEPRAEACELRQVGATEYRTGADIIAAITAAHTCLRQRLDTIHIFSHSDPDGVHGPKGRIIGLYRVKRGSQREGARSVQDLPVRSLADNVVIVLHGCRTAEGDNNFAQSLYNYLARALPNPRVFGHTNRGCAGRDNNWREYSTEHPTGKLRRTISPYHSGYGCCDRPTRTDELQTPVRQPADMESSAQSMNFEYENRQPELGWTQGEYGQSVAVAPESEGESLNDALLYAGIIQNIRQQLALRFADPDDRGLIQRRARLRALFAAVPRSHARELYARLGVTATADELSRFFHGRLATATRAELMRILRARFPTAKDATLSDQPHPGPAMVRRTDPLPASAQSRYRAAVNALRREIDASGDPRARRYLCWLSKLDAGADDRVIPWHRICPRTTGAMGAAYAVGGCDITAGPAVDQAELQSAIRSVADVESAHRRLGFMTHMRSQILWSYEEIGESMQLESFRRFHDEVNRALDTLDFWANAPSGFSSAMPLAYRSIKDWIGLKQRDPQSVYSCL